eukprot:Tbor_TRINITY_DN5327_c7_g2::TRINITY_DN5327_c7_g2_i2::g.4974::m.4974
MTEFKKMTGIVNDELIPKLPILFPTTTGAYSIEYRYATYMTIEKMLPDVHRRFLKMIRRARETDPEKQMFNEKTRQGMEDLYTCYIRGFIDLYYEFQTQKRNAEEEYYVSMRAENERIKSATALANGGVSDDDGLPDEEEMDIHQSKKNGLNLYTSFGDFIAKGEAGAGEAMWGDAVYDDVTTWEHGTVLQQLVLENATHVLKMAELESTAQAAVHNLENIEATEVKKRTLLMAKELADRQTNIIENGKVSRDAARVAQEARELVIWETELTRRREETNRNTMILAIQRRHVSSDGGKMVTIKRDDDDNCEESDCSSSQELFLSESLSNAISTITSIYPPLMKTVLHNLIYLLTEVVCTPESTNIRIIRNDSFNTIGSFGHPCIAETRQVYQAVETILVLAAAYQVRYSKHPSFRTRYIMSLCDRSSLDSSVDTPTCFSSLANKNMNTELMTSVKSISANTQRLYAPVPPACSNPSRDEDYRIQLTYSQMKFEPYSERVLVLREPDALHDPHEWCMWHDHLKYIVKYLKTLVPSIKY